MPAVCRKFDVSSGHKCFVPRKNIEASDDVFINNRGAHRVGDRWKKHKCHKKSHDGVLATGSNTVYVNGRKLGRIRDAISCGDFVMTGSNNVFAG